MGIFDKIFGKKPDTEIPTLSQEAKESLPVLPVIKRSDWQGLSTAHTMPFVIADGKETDLYIVFAQDADDRLHYLSKTDMENPAILAQYNKWRTNIDNYDYEPFMPETLNLISNVDGRIVFAAGHQHSAEKILSTAFVATICEMLKTDQIILSVPRRGLLMATSYHEEFKMLENFFFTHQDAWKDNSDGGELITEMVFVANKDGLLYATAPDFRINLYEKDGDYKIVYSTTSDLLEQGEQINFQAMLERNKIQVKSITD